MKIVTKTPSDSTRSTLDLLYGNLHPAQGRKLVTWISYDCVLYMYVYQNSGSVQMLSLVESEFMEKYNFQTV